MPERQRCPSCATLNMVGAMKCDRCGGSLTMASPVAVAPQNGFQTQGTLSPAAPALPRAEAPIAAPLPPMPMQMPAPPPQPAALQTQPAAAAGNGGVSGLAAWAAATPKPRVVDLPDEDLAIDSAPPLPRVQIQPVTMQPLAPPTPSGPPRFSVAGQEPPARPPVQPTMTGGGVSSWPEPGKPATFSTGSFAMNTSAPPLAPPPQAPPATAPPAPAPFFVNDRTAAPPTPIAPAPAVNGEAERQPAWGVRETRGSAPAFDLFGGQQDGAPAYGAASGSTAAVQYQSPAYAAYGAAAYGAAGYGAAPWQVPQKRSITARLLGGLSLLIMVALIVGGILFVMKPGNSWKHTIAMPATLDGFSENPQVTSEVGGTGNLNHLTGLSDSSNSITDSKYEIYTSGSGSDISMFMLLMVTGTNQWSQAEIDSAINGMDSTGAAIDKSQLVTHSASGVNFQCAPVTVSGDPANVCLWTDGNVMGLVFGIGTRADSSNTLSAAQDAQAHAELPAK